MMIFHLTSIRMDKIKIQTTVHAVEDVEKKEYYSIDGGIANWYNHSRNQSSAFSIGNRFT